MKLFGGSSNNASTAQSQPEQLLQMLTTALHRQTEKWIPCVLNQPVNKEVEVSPEQRDETVVWMCQLNRKFHFYPETFMLATTILDHFLHSVKVRPKYLQCIGVTCLYLAAKTCEEDEVIPATSELVEESMCGRSVSEVLRMERLILDKLNWDLNLVTPLDFIHILHALLMSRMPHLLDGVSATSDGCVMTPSRQLARLTSQLNIVLQQHSVCSNMPPSVIAVSLLSLELESVYPDWLMATLWIQSVAATEKYNIIRCRENIAHCLQKHFQMPATVCGAGQKGGSTGGATKRKVEEMEVDGSGEEDNIYDGIQLLYNMEEVAGGSCSQEAAAAGVGGAESAGLMSPHHRITAAN